MMGKEFVSGCIRYNKESNQKKNSFIICVKVFFEEKPDGNIVAL